MQIKTLSLLAALAGCTFGSPLSTTSDVQEVGGISIGDIINLLGLGLVSKINVDITVQTAVKYYQVDPETKVPAA